MLQSLRLRMPGEIQFHKESMFVHCRDDKSLLCDIHLEGWNGRVNCARQMAMWSIQTQGVWKMMLFVWSFDISRSVNSWCAMFYRILNNQDVCQDTCFCMVPGNGIYIVNHLMIHVLLEWLLWAGFLIHHIVHIGICCHILLSVYMCEVFWSIDMFYSLIHVKQRCKCWFKVWFQWNLGQQFNTYWTEYQFYQQRKTLPGPKGEYSNIYCIYSHGCYIPPFQRMELMRGNEHCMYRISNLRW